MRGEREEECTEGRNMGGGKGNEGDDGRRDEEEGEVIENNMSDLPGDGELT